MTDRIDSHSELHRIMKASNRVIEPPPHIGLTDQDIPFFNSIIDEAARHEWTPHTIDIAAMLARWMAHVEREERTLDSEGYVVETINGGVKTNPRHGVVNILHGMILSTRRSLGLHARAKADPRTTSSRRWAAKQLDDLDDIYDDDLIAKPDTDPDTEH